MPPSIDVLITSYNQQQFLAQCLQSVLLQRGNFKLRLVISDDASTDDTPMIIREFASRYPQKIKVFWQRKNLGRFANKKFLMQKATAPYVATCDGDDFWLDSEKLHKQLNFLTSRPEYSICFTRYRQINEITGETKILPKEKFMHRHSIVESDRLLNQWFVASSSMMFRRDSFEDFPFDQFKYFEDVHLIYQSLRHGQGRILNFVGSCYRLHGDNGFASIDPWEQLQVNQQIFAELLAHFGGDEALRREFEFTTFAVATSAHRRGDDELARTCLQQLAKLSPSFFLQVPYRVYRLINKIKWF